jgi:hypothetical protein
MIGLKPLLGFGDRVPSLLNGGLLRVSPAYWVLVLFLASYWELAKQSDSGFDPLGFVSRFGKERMELSEIKHGRLAMLAVTGFAIQEFVTKIGVVNQTPFFFHPFSTEIMNQSADLALLAHLQPALDQIVTSGFL